jgi:type III restriction enzyme
MKFTLKDYQDEAVRDVLFNLRKARKRWRDEGDKHAFSLTAATGAGKTVMAAAAFEALYYGDDNFDFEADAGAVVIGFSDDPALNEQTRFRLLEASDRLKFTELVVVQNTFNQPKFEVGKVYFLNTQKLSKNSLLVRGFDPDQDGGREEHFPEMRPDLRSYTIWDTIQNTIEDPSITLYLVLDEAHRGMGNSSGSEDDKATIVKRLINGAGSVPAIPVVWGISATVEKFNVAMAGAKGRSTLPNVVVDPAKVQESGLLKDTIILDTPHQAGHFDTVLMRRATDKLKQSNAAWAEYGKQQNEADIVKPLMVLQVPNTPDHNEIGRALDTIFEHWPELQRDAVAHVFGDHTAQTFGRYAVPYISPERVQDSTWVRILLAKDAISTGWDCPRAEVMISFRPAKDRTHITQLLGRMVRTPLARRIPGNDRLNSVDCLLPFFDSKSVEEVADALMNGGVDTGEPRLPGRRVLINPKEMKPNPAIPDLVCDKFLSLPSQSLPQRGAKPVKRLTALAHELSVDGLLADAGKKAHSEMHKVLDAAQARYAHEIVAARKSVLTVEGKTLTADMATKRKTFDEFWEDADYAVIEDAYRRASRIFTADLSRTYSEYLADKNDLDVREDALMEAHANIAALGLVDDVRRFLDAEADKMAKAWLGEYRIPIKRLSDERQEVYRLIREMSTEPQDIDIAKPRSSMEATTIREADGSETLLPTYEKHLLCDEQGRFPVDMNDWEIDVLEAEIKRAGFQAWYRNPSRSSQDSLGIAYTGEDKQVKIVRPDFIFFATQSDGTVVADIVDPHGTHLSDALPKLQGLAKYAETHPDVYRRIETVAKVGDKLRLLDLTAASVRQAIAEAKDAKTLYAGAHAIDY